ncbi:MAG TPA: xanthine dehydrogenase family protein subunit M [Spongiibacteraceae bacterium]
MQDFRYQRVNSIEDAIHALQQQPAAKFIGGGTNLLDLMKGDVEKPDYLIDITRLPLAQIRVDDNGLLIGALMRNSDVANHAHVRKHYPLLAQALVAGASPQLRNMATAGGNLLQRTRCGYFYDTAYAQCNKRLPGSGCAARAGIAHNHAIFGASEHCIAINPSDMSVALVALDASVRVQGPQGQRVIPLADFFRLPGETPHIDTNLQRDELIVAVELPPARYAQHSHYLKIRERSSYAFALVSVAAALDISGDKINDARIALGGVAHKPWRLNALEDALRGNTLSVLNDDALIALAVRDAQPSPQNAYKISLVRTATRRALAIAGAVT